jgi:uncharacterized membrane protein YkoI
MSSLPRDLEKKLGPSSAEIDPKFKQQLKQSLFKEKTMAVSNPLIRFLKYTRSTPALATLTALVIVGSASGLVATHQANNARQTEIEVPASIDDLISFEEVRAIADKDAPNGSITGIELEKEDNGMVYKVKFSDGSIRIYDAKTGQAISDDNDHKAKDKVDVPANLSSNITATEARSIALKQRSGTVTKIELETEEGVLVYSVRFSDGGRVDVNAANGNIVRVRNTSNTGTSSPGTSSSNQGSSSGSSSDSDDDDGGSSNSGSGQSGGLDDSEHDDDHHSGSNSGSSGSDNSGHGSDD